MRVGAADHIGEPLSSALPHLEGLTELVFENLSPREAARDVDVVLMGLPHRASVELVEAAIESGVRVLDLSGAFRLKDPEAYRRFYGEVHARPDLLGEFVYGLPELNRERLKGGALGGLAGLLRHLCRARSPALRARRAALRRDPYRGGDRLERQRRDTEPDHSPPGASREPTHL